jgi:hypothetical protein
MQYAVEMGLNAMICSYIPGDIKIGSGTQKLMTEGIHRHRDSTEIA